ncbi:hypothetical protein [Actinacidiphila glaucinigra]|uniref:hypothetical protein n=1 Tax=Actinacidiphila glaucinigra TaxID=235986 RepID=UPI003D926691
MLGQERSGRGGPVVEAGVALGGLCDQSRHRGALGLGARDETGIEAAADLLQAVLQHLELALHGAGDPAEVRRGLPPATAVRNADLVGTWMKNQRTERRIADAVAQRRETGLPVGSTAGAPTEEIRGALDAIRRCPSRDALLPADVRQGR